MTNKVDDALVTSTTRISVAHVKITAFNFQIRWETVEGTVFAKLAIS